MTDNNKKAALTERLRKCYSGAVYDALRERGIDNTVLPKTSGRLTILMFLLVPFSQFREHQNLGSVQLMPCWLGRVSFQQRRLAMS